MRPALFAIALVLGVCRGSSSDPTPAPSPGGGCSTDADCSAEELCEGEGCDGATGTCVAKSRMCTRDAQLYCGCDGTEFRASGSCPGRRYRSRGACAPAS
jgi:hypothetical protein